MIPGTSNLDVLAYGRSLNAQEVEAGRARPSLPTQPAGAYPSHDDDDDDLSQDGVVVIAI